VVMENIGDLTVLIGPNSSGKSNLLEALTLFFNELDPSIQRTIGPIKDYNWFDRDFQSPIEFTITVELRKEELEEIFPNNLSSKLKIVDEMNILTISREISGTPTSAVWKTNEIEVNDVSLIKDGQLVLPPGEIVRENSNSEDSESSPDILEIIIQNISKKFKGTFVYIPSARNVTASDPELRDRFSIIQSSLLSELNKIGQSFKREHERQWIKVEEHMKKASPNVRDLRIISGQVTIREEGDIHFPVSFVGGGTQEILMIIYNLFKEEGEFFGIEEPELHLHPQLSRRLFSILSNRSGEKQIFITTHSTIFVDQANLHDTWLVRMKNRETEVNRIKEPERLRDVLYELGNRPSDIFLSNGIIFVEGPSDRIVFSNFFEKMEIDLKSFGVSIIPIYGKASGKYHFKVWTEAASNVQIPYFMILDSDAKKEAKTFIDNGILEPNQNLFILQKGSIEEYYPEDKLINALKLVYDLKLENEEKEKQLAEALKTPRQKNIEKFLEEKSIDKKGWKVKIGEEVSRSMELREIDEEIKRIIERIATK